MTKVKFVLEAGRKSPIHRSELLIESDDSVTDSEAKEDCLIWLNERLNLWMQSDTGKKIPVMISKVRFAPKKTSSVAENATVVLKESVEQND